MSYSLHQTMKILRTQHKIKSSQHMTAKTLKDDLSRVPDDAILLGFKDGEFDSDFEIIFQKESELPYLDNQYQIK